MTIKRFQPLSDLAKRTRLQMTIQVADMALIDWIIRELAEARGSSGLVRFVVPIASGGEAAILFPIALRRTRSTRAF